MKKKLIILVLVIFALSGALFVKCYFTGDKQAIIEKALEKEYGRKFEVLSLYDRDRYTTWVETRLIETPNYVFRTAVYKKNNRVMDLYYMEPFMALVASETEAILREDIKQFYPEFEVVAHVNVLKFSNDAFDASKAQIEEILKNSKSEGTIGGCFVDIFFSKKDSTYEDYSEEFDYYTKQIDKYIEESRMLPLTINFYLTDSFGIQRVKEYKENNSIGFEYGKMVENMKKATVYFNSQVKEELTSRQEYIEIRERLENE